MKLKNKSIILYDDRCNLCNRSVQFIIKQDPNKQFLFVSLQSDAAAKHLLQLNSKNTNLNSIVLIDADLVYIKSNAILQILKKTGGFWALFFYLKIIPEKLRDSVYDIIAKNRYKWFGKRDICHLQNSDTNKNRSIKF